MKSSTSMLISLLFAGNCLADDDPLTKQKWLKKFSGSWKAVKVQVDGEDVEKDEASGTPLSVIQPFIRATKISSSDGAERSTISPLSCVS